VIGFVFTNVIRHNHIAYRKAIDRSVATGVYRIGLSVYPEIRPSKLFSLYADIIY